MRKFIRRVFGALALLPYVYEEVEADHSALPQALTVVVLSSLASGVAFWPDVGAPGVVLEVIATVLGWLVWSWLVYHIGTRWLPGEATEADWGELLRTTGFASAPGMFRVFALFAETRTAILAFTAAWMLVAFVLAVRQALDYRSSWRALAVCLTGFAIYAGLLFIAPTACELAGRR